MLRPLTAASAALLAVFLVSCRHATPDNVAAAVNGRAITYAELDKQYQTQFMSSGEKPSEDQAMIQKLELLRTMMDSEIMQIGRATCMERVEISVAAVS